VLDLTTASNGASATADEASAPTDSEVSGTTQTDGEAAQTAKETDAAASEA